MAIYTRRGDAGQTGLGDGSRVSKASARVEAYGTLDEAGAALGLARTVPTDARIEAPLEFAQQRLFNCAATLATPDAQSASLSDGDVAYLERAIDQLQALSGPWSGFVLASGGEAACRLHMARTVVRRAERRIVELAQTEQVDATVLAFVNRLSDLLFAAASAAASLGGEPEQAWERDAEAPSV